MIPVGAILKMAKGGLNPDEIIGLLATMGIEVQFSELLGVEIAAGFQGAATQTLQPGVKVYRLNGSVKSGEQLSALVIVAPKK